MRLKTKEVKVSTGGPLIAILNKKDAEKLDLFALDRIKIKSKNKEINTLIDISSDKDGIKPGEIGLLEETYKIIKSKLVDISPSENPKSIEFIRKKLDGKKLTKKEIKTIIDDLMLNNLSDIEVTYFVSACYNHDLDDEEVANLTKATVNEGKKLKFAKKIVADKHCIGGVPNNRTTMLITPILAAAGLTMAKTSSRAITSPAGTADTMEVLAKVDFEVKKIKQIVNKTNACIVWNGSMDIAGADSRLIKVRHPLRLDPEGLLVASILSKKMAVGATHLIIDIPVGKHAKIKTKKEASKLKRRFIKIANLAGIKTKVIITNGSQPIGNGIGPALEAKDILHILKRDPESPKDLEEKAIKMADYLFRLTKTKASAKEILNSGQAYKKMKEIIFAQQGKPNIKPEDIEIGGYSYNLLSPKDGKIKDIEIIRLSNLARIAGAPQNKGAGVYVYKKIKDKVKKGDILLTIYAENKDKLNFAKKETKDIFLLD